MIPAGVDVEDLAGQIRHDGVAFSQPDLAADSGLQSEIRAELAQGEALAVIDVHPRLLADVRDVAQELYDATDFHTVIVQSPAGVSAVSDVHSRASLEAAQQPIAPGVTQVEALGQFHAGLGESGPAWGVILAVAVVIAACLAAVVFRQARRA